MSSIERNHFLGVDGRALPLPCYFPAMSSVKADTQLLDYLQVIEAAQHPLFLVSAYDIHNAPAAQHPLVKATIERLRRGAAVALCDSGNYESYWKNDRSWRPEQMASVYRDIPFSLSFSFDNQFPKGDADAIAADVVSGVERDQSLVGEGTIVPIVHGDKRLLPQVAGRVAKTLAPMLLAVPERELGDGILERAGTVAAIRRELDEAGYYCPLHLLGTGNPASVLIYAAAGADSFDGLEWCQAAIDHRSGALLHFHQWELVAETSPVAHVCDVPYAQTVLVHNLLYYRKWLDDIHGAMVNGTMDGLLAAHLPRRFLDALQRTLRGGTP